MVSRDEESVKAYARAQSFFNAHSLPEECWLGFPLDWFEEIRVAAANCLSKFFVASHGQSEDASTLDREIDSLGVHLSKLIRARTGSFAERSFPTGLERTGPIYL